MLRPIGPIRWSLSAHKHPTANARKKEWKSEKVLCSSFEVAELVLAAAGREHQGLLKAGNFQEMFNWVLERQNWQQYCMHEMLMKYQNT